MVSNNTWLLTETLSVASQVGALGGNSGPQGAVTVTRPSSSKGKVPGRARDSSPYMGNRDMIPTVPTERVGVRLPVCEESWCGPSATRVPSQTSGRE